VPIGSFKSSGNDCRGREAPIFLRIACEVFHEIVTVVTIVGVTVCRARDWPVTPIIATTREHRRCGVTPIIVTTVIQKPCQTAKIVNRHNR
jgi:hypothetical protein